MMYNDILDYANQYPNEKVPRILCSKQNDKSIIFRLTCVIFFGYEGWTDWSDLDRSIWFQNVIWFLYGFGQFPVLNKIQIQLDSIPFHMDQNTKNICKPNTILNNLKAF